LIRVAASSLPLHSKLRKPMKARERAEEEFAQENLQNHQRNA
jgi:hypothetical protein